MIVICTECGALLRIHIDHVLRVVRKGLCAVCRDDRDDEQHIATYEQWWQDVGGEGGGA